MDIPCTRSLHKRLRQAWCILVVVSWPLAGAGQVRAPAPRFELTLKLLVGGEVFGPVLDYSDELVVLEYQGWPCAVVFDELTVASAYSAKRALLARERGGIDQLSAEDRFQLGRYALRRDHPRLANKEFKEAQRLDRSYQARIEAAQQQYQAARQAADPTGPRSRLEEEAPTDEVGVLPGLTETVGQTPPEDRERIIDAYKRFGQSVRETINEDLALIETDHFLIWTDWNRIRRPQLAQWCEAMYGALCVQFGLDTGDGQNPNENIFLGKCPVFCFRSKARFLRFARTYDNYQGTSIVGYTKTAPNGHVHLAVYRRGPSSYEIDRFAGTLVHEGVHAFLHRYKQAGHISGWVAEGLADYIAEQVLDDRCPYGEKAELVARQYALRDIPIDDLLPKTWQPKAHEYPVAFSLVGFLIERDREAFAGFIGDLKAGCGLEQSLQRNYDGMTFQTLETAWRKWVRSRM